MTEAGDTLRIHKLCLSESTEHFLKKAAAFHPTLAVKLEYDIYSVSVNCIPTSPPIWKSIFSPCTSESWEHCLHLHCKPFPHIVMQLNYLCVTSSFFNKLQQDLGNFTIVQIFPWNVINIFHSYWVCLLSKSCSIVAYFLLKSLTIVHSVLSAPSLIKINKNHFMYYSTWNNQNLACQLKIFLVVGICNFLYSLWYYRMFE